jgi:hypothetical protein
MQRDAVVSRRRHIRYADSSNYAESIFNSSELGGIAVELFRRLGTAGPFFVETGHRSSSLASALERGFAWKGITLNDSAPETIRGELAERGAPVELDFLSVYGENAQRFLAALRSYRPRVVTCMTETVFDGYVCVATGLFVREDLALRAGFEQPVTAQS